MPRPCPKRVRQLKQHTPNRKTIFPVYFFLRRPSWHLGRIIFHCSLGRRKPLSWHLDGIIFHCSLGRWKPSWHLDRTIFHCLLERRKPAKEKINRKNSFAIWCRTRHAGTSTCHAPAPQCSCSSSPISGKLATLEPPLVMFQRHDAQVSAAQSLANSPRWNPHPL